MDTLKETLRKLLLAGIGATAVTAEKAEELVEVLVKKGELTVEQGKILNEELKHNVKSKLRECIGDDDISITEKLSSMTTDELNALKEKIAEVEQQKNAEPSLEEEKNEG